MIKFIYILNNKKELIDLCKIDSERYEVLKKVIPFEIQEELLPIEFNIYKIEKLIDSLLIERNLKPLDVPDYKGRFLESEIFEIKKYKNEELKLCNSGFDNKIIFLLNLYNSVLNCGNPHHMFFLKNHSDFLKKN